MTPVGNILKNFMLDILAPKSCIGCKKDDVDLCDTCAAAIPRAQLVTCPLCLTASNPWICPSCRTHSPLDALSFPFLFHDSRVQEIIHLFKYQGFRDLSYFLGSAMSTTVSYYPFHENWKILPIPLHRRRLNERGYNQTELLAEVIAEKLQVPLEENTFIRTRYTTTQVELTRIERQQNLEGAFAITKPENIQGHNILLIDDVATTLTTLETSARILKANGAALVWAVTAARADGSD